MFAQINIVECEAISPAGEALNNNLVYALNEVTSFK